MSLTLRWWQHKGEAAAVQAWKRFSDILSADADRREHNLAMLRQYLNRDLQDYGYSLYATDRNTTRSLNLTKSVVDAIATKVAKIRPKATFLTSKGDFSLRRKAENLDRYVSGQYSRLGVYGKIERLVKDAEIYGTGVWHVYREGSRIELEQVYPSELAVDHREAVYRQPREIFRHKRVSRDVLKAVFPGSAEAIDSASSVSSIDSAMSDYDYGDDTASSADMVTVVAGWRLPSAPDAGDGRYIVMLEDALLELEEYDREYFPFLFFSWDEPPMGFWGQGLVEQVRPIDIHVNEMLDRIEQAQRLGSVPMGFVEQGSFVGGVEKMNNQPMNLYEIKQGMRQPSWAIPPTVSPEYFQHLERRINQAFETTGVSQLSAQSQKPSGLDAAVALREMVDIESERFILPTRRLEQLIGVSLAERVIDLTKEIAADPDADKAGLTVKAVDGRDAFDIKWKDVDLDRDAYVLRVFPASSLPQQPAARRASVQELMESGLVSPEEGRELIDMPDLEAFNERRLAGTRLIERIIENILEEGRYIGPEPYFPLQEALARFQEAYMSAVIDNVDDSKLQALRRWMLSAENLLLRTQPPAPQPPPEVEPPGVPSGAPPVPGEAALPAPPAIQG
ncbi:MAG: hypothetical protein GWN58_58645 [Anaerolineae bacterium]|nr:hypothetical protein [Anaerolineae bacterium]